jgi:hypothetical protein
MAAFFMFYACSANVNYHRVTDDDKATGVRYYESSPYLLVYPNGRNGLRWQILYLPDQSKEMEACPNSIGGRSELTMYFQNGMLASNTGLVDSTAIPKALIAAVQAAIPTIAGLREAMPVEPTQRLVPAPSLYKIVVRGDKVAFYGCKGDVDVIVPTIQAN